MKKAAVSTVLSLTLASLGAIGVPAGSALAAGPMYSGQCPTGKTYYEVVSKTSSWVTLAGPYHYINKSRTLSGTHTFKIDKGGTKSASTSVGAESQAGALIAQAKVSVSATISKSVSWSTSMSVTMKVPPGKTVYASYGTNQYRITFRKFEYAGNCTKFDRGRVTLTAPSSTGWKTW